MKCRHPNYNSLDRLVWQHGKAKAFRRDGRGRIQACEVMEEEKSPMSRSEVVGLKQLLLGWFMAFVSSIGETAVSMIILKEDKTGSETIAIDRLRMWTLGWIGKLEGNVRHRCLTISS